MFSRSSPPSSAYRGTIRHLASGERKYIRYFDGRGHFGHVSLQVIPRPGADCWVSWNEACGLPDEACMAAQRALSGLFDGGSHLHVALIGFEVRLTGGAYLPRYSYPEACAVAACMAFDEALRRAAPEIVETYVRVSLRVEFDALVWTLKALATLVGELRSTQRFTNVVHLDLEVPARLLKEIQSLGVVRVSFLPRNLQYQPAAPPGGSLPDFLDEWT